MVVCTVVCVCGSWLELSLIREEELVGGTTSLHLEKKKKLTFQNEKLCGKSKKNNLYPCI